MRDRSLGKLTAAIAETGGALQSVDLVPGAGAEGKRVREFTIDARDQSHWETILRAIGSTRGARVLDYVDRTMAMHRGGKIEQSNKYPLKTRDDLSMAYTPGVARVCQEIAADRQKAFEFTIKKNTVAVVSDGSAVLGLGDIGPEAAMPVMEGKAMLFKEFADVDAFPICLDTNDPDRIIEAVTLMAPTFGGINLEDISAPRCFYIEETLKEELDIPVFHDDQHGTAVVTMAALFNALEDRWQADREPARAGGRPGRRRGGRDQDDARVRGRARNRLRPPGRTLDRAPRLRGRQHLRHQALVRGELEPGQARRWAERGDRGLRRVRRAFRPRDSRGAIAREDGGRSDRVRDVQPDSRGHARGGRGVRADHGYGPLGLPESDQQRLCFPGVFRGALDAGASRITEPMKLAAAKGIAEVVADADLSEDYIIPSVFDRDVAPAVAKAVVEEARREGIARVSEETGTFSTLE